jgi:hypothetical protein
MTHSYYRDAVDGTFSCPARSFSDIGLSSTSSLGAQALSAPTLSTGVCMTPDAASLPQRYATVYSENKELIRLLGEFLHLVPQSNKQSGLNEYRHL